MVCKSLSRRKARCLVQRNGRLVSECRKEDYLIHGRPIFTVRKKKTDVVEKQAAS